MLLEELAGEGERGRIFSVTKLPGGMFELRERCDDYYYAKLTEGEVERLGRELIALANGQHGESK